MPCHAAQAEKSPVFEPNTAVENALKELKKKKVDYGAVVDEQGVMHGVFSLQSLMKNLLPVSVAMPGGLQLDVTVRAAPGVAKRLKNAMVLPVTDFMQRKYHYVYPDTPIWEGINQLMMHGAPIAIIEPETQKFIGFITERSALDELNRIQEGE